MLGCAVLTALFAVVVMSGTAWLRRTLVPPAPPAPALSPGVALRARYLLTDGRSFDDGCGVAVRLQPTGKPVVLTPLSPFAPDGGHFTKGVAPADVHTVVRGVELRPWGSETVVARVHKQLRTTGPAMGEKEVFVDNDVLAWELEAGTGVQPLELATQNPRLFSWTWLVGDSPKHRPQTQQLFAARVVGNQVREAWVKLDARFPMESLKGAPLIDADRRLVATVSRGFPGRAAIVPAADIRARLNESGVR